MEDRSNYRLNIAIEDKIREWEGTIYGSMMKNAYENGCSYESVCEVCDLDYSEYEEE